MFPEERGSQAVLDPPLELQPKLLRALHKKQFVRNASGVYTTFDITGATGLTVAGINDSGEVAGTYFDSTFHSHGYSRTVAGAIITLAQTFLQSINASGTFVGWDSISQNYSYGFVRNANGTTPTLEMAGASNTEPNSVGQQITLCS